MIRVRILFSLTAKRCFLLTIKWVTYAILTNIAIQMAFCVSKIA